MNPITANRRHYEDLVEGEVVDLGTTSVSKDMLSGSWISSWPKPA